MCEVCVKCIIVSAPRPPYTCVHCAAALYRISAAILVVSWVQNSRVKCIFINLFVDLLTWHGLPRYFFPCMRFCLHTRKNKKKMEIAFILLCLPFYCSPSLSTHSLTHSLSVFVCLLRREGTWTGLLECIILLRLFYLDVSLKIHIVKIRVSTSLSLSFSSLLSLTFSIFLSLPEITLPYGANGNECIPCSRVIWLILETPKEWNLNLFLRLLSFSLLFSPFFLLVLLLLLLCLWNICGYVPPPVLCSFGCAAHSAETETRQEKESARLLYNALSSFLLYISHTNFQHYNIFSG